MTCDTRSSDHRTPHTTRRPDLQVVSTTDGDKAVTPPLPPGPMSRSELQAMVPAAVARDHYTRLWHDSYRLTSQPDTLALRSAALAHQCPQGVLCGQSAAQLWGDDSAPDSADAEVWLPTPRAARPGRRYRRGVLDERAITERHGLPVTTLLRTCIDLARWAPDYAPNTPTHGRDPAAIAPLTVTLDRLGAVHPQLGELLRAYLAHPSSGGSPSAPARTRKTHQRLQSALAASDARSVSSAASRSRVALNTTLGPGFQHAYTVTMGTRSTELELANPAHRIAVIVDAVHDRARPHLAGPGHGLRTGLDREISMLRRAGWSVIISPQQGNAPLLMPDSQLPGVEDCGLPATKAANILRTLWPQTALLPPEEDERCVLDPVGMWQTYSGAAGSRW